MAFDWREYLALAQFIQHQVGNDYSHEAARRCAVSRAYYAAFCHARNYAQLHYDFVPSHRAHDHEQLRRHLQQKGRTDIARELSQLRQWRNLCDYDDSVANLPRLTSSALELANRVIAHL